MGVVDTTIFPDQRAREAPFDPATDIPATNTQEAIERVQSNLAAADAALRAPEYIVAQPSATLGNERVATDTDTIVWDFATPSQAKASVPVDTDGTLAANSDTKIPSQKAIKTYVDQIIAAQDAMVFKGVIDCSVNPNYPAADRGHTYRVSVAGKIGGGSGPNVEVGDLLMCLTDGTASGNHATVGAHWAIIQTNLDGAVIGPASATDSHFAQFDGVTGKLLKDGISLDTDGTMAANSDARVPSQQAVREYVASAPSALPRGYLHGLEMANNGIDPTNDIDIEIGACRADDNLGDMVLGSALTKRLDAAWAVGTNQGGLDTGSISNATYHVWVIKRSDTGVVDVLLSLSATAPTMPANYDFKRRIGSIVRTGGAILGFRQTGDLFRYASERSVYNSTSSKASALTDMLVPTGLALRPILRYFQQQSTAGLFVSGLGDAAAGSADTDFATTSIASESVASVLPPIWFTNTSAQLYHAVTTTGGTLNVNALLALGWIDARGRDE